MKESDITKDNVKCKISDNMHREYNKMAIIPIMEQETILNKQRDQDYIIVDTTDQTIINKMLKSEFFTLEQFLLSDHPKNKNYVLGIRGTLENRGMTIRKKKPVFSDEEKKRRADRMRKMDLSG